MLQNIHDKAKGWVAYAIVGFIAIPFALFGISSYLGGSNSLVAATVNGEDIPVQQVQNAVLQQRQRLTQMFGGKLPVGFNSDSIKKQALEGAINEVLLRQEAEANDYRASNQEVYDTIASIPAFQKNGVFDSETYERLLAAQRRNKAGFEAEIRQSISNQQFSSALTAAAFIPTSDATRYQQLQNQTRNVDTFTLKKADYKDQVTVADDEVKGYFDKNAAQFMTAEKVKLSYIELKKSDLASSVEVDQGILEGFYDENIGRYTDPEQRKISHILVKIDAEKDGVDAEKKAEAKAQALYDQIKNDSKTFEDLATNNSDDKFSAKKSGDIGLIARGDMGALFEKLAFSLSKGEYSKPTKAEAGFEIVKVTDVVASTVKSFADVKSEVEKFYRDEESEKLFFDSSEKIQTLAFENDSTLDTAADAIGATVKTSDWISKGVKTTGKSVLDSPKLIAAAFSDDVINNGKNSELLEIDSETVVLVRIQDHDAPKQKPMTDVSSNIKDILSTQKLRKLLIEKGELVLTKLKETSDWSALSVIGATADKLVKNEALKRTDNKLSKVLVDKIFSMQKPEGGKASFDNVILPDGNYVLAAVNSVTAGDSKADSALQDGFAREVGSREQQAMLKALREQADVNLFLENIQ